MKKRAVVIIVFMLCLLSIGIVYIFSELYTENDIEKVKNDLKNTDAYKFKEEYESYNGGSMDDGTPIRELSIDEDNPFVYSTAKNIIDMINNNETFIVYFGFAKCPWCRAVMDSAIMSAKENKIKKIYYVDVSNIRDLYELDSNNNAIKTVEGTEEYYKLLELLDSVLTEYTPLTYTNSKGKEKKVSINEKRIYAPTFVMVKNGNAFKSEVGLTSIDMDPYEEINEEIKCHMNENFDCFFKEFDVQESLTCTQETRC